MGRVFPYDKLDSVLFSSIVLLGGYYAAGGYAF